MGIDLQPFARWAEAGSLSWSIYTWASIYSLSRAGPRLGLCLGQSTHGHRSTAFRALGRGWVFVLVNLHMDSDLQPFARWAEAGSLSWSIYTWTAIYSLSRAGPRLGLCLGQSTHG